MSDSQRTWYDKEGFFQIFQGKPNYTQAPAPKSFFNKC